MQAGCILGMDQHCATAEAFIFPVDTFQHLQMKCTEYKRMNSWLQQWTGSPRNCISSWHSHSAPAAR